MKSLQENSNAPISIFVLFLSKTQYLEHVFSIISQKKKKEKSNIVVHFCTTFRYLS